MTGTGWPKLTPAESAMADALCAARNVGLVNDWSFEARSHWHVIYQDGSGSARHLRGTATLLSDLIREDKGRWSVRTTEEAFLRLLDCMERLAEQVPWWEVA